MGKKNRHRKKKDVAVHATNATRDRCESGAGGGGQVPRTLFDAAKDGDLPVVQLLFERGSKAIYQRSANDGATPLYVACLNGHDAIVQILSEPGSMVIDRPTNTGATPLYAACAKGHDTIVQVLLDRGSKAINRPTNNGANPLIVAVQQGQFSTVTLLLDRGALVDLPDAIHGGTALIYASVHGKMTTAKLLVRRGANLEHVAYDGKTAHDLALEHGHPPLARWLRRARGFTPLHFACDARDDAEVLRMLREGAIDICARSNPIPPPAAAAATAAAAVTPSPPATALDVAGGVSDRTLELMQWASAPWIPEHPEVWPASFRRAVRVMLLVKLRANRRADERDRVQQLQLLQHNLPLRGVLEALAVLDVWVFVHHVMSFCGRDWFRFRLCAHCKVRAAMKLCGFCKRLLYCSRECQRTHWKAGHRQACSREFATKKKNSKKK